MSPWRNQATVATARFI